MSLAVLLQANALEPSPGMTVLIGVVIVFGVLLALTVVFWLFGVVAGAGSRRSAGPKPAPAPAPKLPKKPASVPAPVIEDGVPDEVVAVIAAAIAAMSDGTTRYAVRRISPARSQGARPVWAAAGIAENTQPF